MAKKKGKILYVENDQPLATLYEIQFTNKGFDIAIADCGKEALKLASEFKPDLILLDLLLKDIGGLDVLKKLKADPATKNIKVIAFSNFNIKGLEDQCKEAGAMDFWLKSKYIPKEIVEKCEEILNEE